MGQGKSAIDSVLAESFKELALKQPVEKITIKEITDGAGVIRTTFYNHFQDKYELLEWIIYTDLLKPIEPLIHTGMFGEAFVLIFTRIKQEKEFYTKVSRLEGQNSFKSIAEGCVTRVLLGVMQEYSTKGKRSKYNWLDSERIAEYYAQSLCYIVIAWIKTGMTISPKELAEIYSYMLTHSMENILSEMVTLIQFN